LNLYPKRPLLITHSTRMCWRGLLMPWGTSKDSCGEIAHQFSTMTVCRHIHRFKCSSF
jgi:hypothetical protein